MYLKCSSSSGLTLLNNFCFIRLLSFNLFQFAILYLVHLNVIQPVQFAVLFLVQLNAVVVSRFYLLLSASIVA